MVYDDGLEDCRKVHDKSAQQGQFMGPDGDNRIKTDPEGIVEEFLAAVFIGDAADVDQGGRRMQGMVHGLVGLQWDPGSVRKIIPGSDRNDSQDGAFALWELHQAVDNLMHSPIPTDGDDPDPGAGDDGVSGLP